MNPWLVYIILPLLTKGQTGEWINGDTNRKIHASSIPANGKLPARIFFQPILNSWEGEKRVKIKRKIREK